MFNKILEYEYYIEQCYLAIDVYRMFEMNDKVRQSAIEALEEVIRKLKQFKNN